MKSKWFVDQLDVGTRLRASALIPAKLKEMRKSLEACETVSQIASVWNYVAIDLVEGVMFRGYEPHVLRASAAMIERFRDRLKPMLDLTTHANYSVMVAMNQAINVLAMGEKSIDAAREWCFADTKGGWDSYYMKALLSISAETGVNPVDFKDEHYQMVGRNAQEYFASSLRDRGLTGTTLFSAFMPHLYDKAFAVAELRAQATQQRPELHADRIQLERANTGQTKREARNSAKLHSEAGKVLREALNQLPRERNAKGKKLRPSLDLVESLVGMEQYLVQQLDVMHERIMGRLH